MKIYIQTSPGGNLLPITIDDTPLGKGGQGAVHKIITATYKADYCIKIYFKTTDEVYKKIKYMVAHQPKDTKNNPDFRICWPTAIAYDTNKKFIGYMMPLAFAKGHDLTILSVYQRKPLAKMKKYKALTEWHNKFELDTEIGIINRIKMLKNVATALHRIHETGRYVIVDLKPENIDATGTGKISIMDTDSIQISEGGKILHPATAYTPDYFAPEGESLKAKGKPYTVECDLFSAAVCFYQILTGTHPYAGTVLRAPYDQCTEVSQCIAEGLFAYGEKSKYISFPTGLNLQQNFKNLPPVIQELFKRAFGSKKELRPTMEEWGKAFYSVVIAGVTVKASDVKRTTSNPFTITGISYSDEDKSGNVIRARGSKLYTDVTYLCPTIEFNVTEPVGRVNLHYRIISPKGEEVTSANTSGSINANATGSHKQEIGGWGNEKKTAYKVPGEYHIEIYYQNKCIYKSTFTIYPLGSKGSTTTTTTTSSTAAPFSISNASFLSTNKAFDIMTPAGNTLYTNILYLNAKIVGYATKPFSTDQIFIRITDPNGKVVTNSQKSSKSGFYQTSITLKQGGNFTITLGGYGNDNGTLYSVAGRYKYEIYYQDTCLYSASVHIYEKKSSTAPTPAPKPKPRPTSTGGSSWGSGSRKREGLWSKLNRAVVSIGDWIEDREDTISDGSIWMIIFAVIGGLGLLAGAISTGSWFWGIAICVVGYAIGVYVVAIGGVVFGWIAGILAKFARYIFYNIYTLLATLAVVAGTIFYQDIIDFVDGYRGYTPKSVKTATQPQQTTTTTYICISQDVLNIRSAPNTYSDNVIGTIIPQQTIEVISINNGWAKVKYHNQVAYASAKYLKPLK